jgi:hypothetical protein
MYGDALQLIPNPLPELDSFDSADLSLSVFHTQVTKARRY